MENNNYQQQYQQPYQQQYQEPYQPYPNDPNYPVVAKEFLTKAIVAGAISSMPVGSIIGAVMGSRNRKKILEYIENGGPHTVRLKVCSAVSRAAKYAGIGFSIWWAIYALIYTIYIIGIFALLVTQSH